MRNNRTPEAAWIGFSSFFFRFVSQLNVLHVIWYMLRPLAISPFDFFAEASSTHSVTPAMSGRALSSIPGAV